MQDLMNSTTTVDRLTEYEKNNSMDYFMEWDASYQAFVKTYQALARTLMGMGVVGNGLGLLTLTLAKGLQTPHFIFYKAIAVAELFYCLTYFASEIMESAFMSNGVPEFQRPFYTTLFAAYFRGIGARLIFSSTGYLVLYMTLLLTADRLAALWFCSFYKQTTNKRKGEISVIATFVFAFVSIVINSWDACFEQEVLMSVKGNVTIYEVLPRAGPDAYLIAQKVKNIYNMAVRIPYPFVLLVTTLVVILGFIRFHRKRQNLVNSRRTTQERRRELNLFYLMIAVVLLAFIQVLPRETMRVIELHAGTKKDLWKFITQGWYDRVDGITYERVIHATDVYWVSIYLLLLANLATQIDRSLKFYLYIVLNSNFRSEAVKLFFGWFPYQKLRYKKVNTNVTTLTMSEENGSPCRIVAVTQEEV